MLRLGSLVLGEFGEFAAGAGSDFVQLAAVGGGLFGQRLHQGGLQGQQLLRVFDAQQRLGVARGVGQRRAGGLHVELQHALDALKGLLRQAKKGFDVGFLGGNHLFGGQHGEAPEKGGQVRG